MVGVDRHKGSHTAVAIDRSERQLGRLRVRASAAQAGQLTEWAATWPDRCWAVEGNRGTTLHPARPAHTPHASSSDQ